MYWLDSKQSAGTNQKTFFCDSTADISNLPTITSDGEKQGDDPVSNKKVGLGSTCLVVGTGDVYMLDSNNEWTKLGG